MKKKLIWSVLAVTAIINSASAKELTLECKFFANTTKKTTYIFEEGVRPVVPQWEMDWHNKLRFNLDKMEEKRAKEYFKVEEYQLTYQAEISRKEIEIVINRMDGKALFKETRYGSDKKSGYHLQYSQEGICNKPKVKKF